jgi:copper chaperone
LPTTSYLVTGMTCQHCVHAVTEEVSAVAGVSKVTIDLDSGRLTVASSDEVPFAAIATAVDEAGYVIAPGGSGGVPPGIDTAPA